MTAFRTEIADATPALTTDALQNARLFKGTGETTTAGFTLEIHWPDFDTTQAMTQAQRLRTLRTVTNPTVNGGSWTGTFAVSEPEITDDGQRAGEVRLKLTLVTVVDGADAAAYLADIEGASREIKEITRQVFPFDDTDDYVVSAETEKTQLVEYTYPNLSPLDGDGNDARTKINLVTDDALQASATVNPNSWGLVERTLDDDPRKGTLTLKLVFADEERDATIAEHTTETTAAVIQQNTVHHDRGTETLIGDTVPADGEIVSQRVQRISGGRFEKTRSVRTVQDQTGLNKVLGADSTVTVATNTATSYPTVPEAGTDGQFLRYDIRPLDYKAKYAVNVTTDVANDIVLSDYDKNGAREITVTTHSAGSEVSEPATPTAGTIVRASQNPTKYLNRYATREETITALDQVDTDYDISASRSVTTVRHTQGDELSTPTPADGTIVRIDQRQTEFKKFETTQRTDTVINQTGVDTTHSAFSTVTVDTNTATAYPTIPTAGVDGQVIKYDANPTAYPNKYEVNVVTDTVNDVVAYDYDKTGAREVTTTTHSATTALSEPATPTAGTIVRASQNPTKYLNRFSTREDVVTAIDQVDTDYEVTAARSVTTVHHTQGDALSTPTPADGTVVRINQRQTEFQKFDTVEATDTVTNQTGVDKTHSALSTVTVDSDSAIAYPTIPTAGVDGQLIKYEVRPTAYPNKYAVNVITDEANDVVLSDYDKTGAREITVTTHSAGSELTEPSDPVAGTIVKVSQAPTKYLNRYQTRRETVTALDQVDTDYDFNAARNVTTVRHSQGDEIATPANPAAGTMIRVDQRQTEFQKFDTVYRTETVANQTGDRYVVRGDQTVTVATNTQGSQVAAPASVDGQIKEVQSVPTEAGLYRTVEETRTVTNQTGATYEEGHDQSASVTVNTATTDPGTLGAASPGQLLTRQVSPTEYPGRYRVTDRTVTAEDQTGSLSVDRADQSLSIETHTQNASALTTASAVTGTTVRNTSVPTRFGRYQTQAVTTTAKAQTTGSFTASVGVDYISTRENYTNQATPSTLDGSTKGEAYYKKNEFDLYDGYLITKTARDVSDTFTSHVVSGANGSRPLTTVTYWHHDAPQPGGDDYTVIKHDDEKYTTHVTTYGSAAWMDTSKAETEKQTRTNAYGQDEARTITYTRYYKFADTQINVMSKINDAVKGSVRISRGDGFWQATYLVLGTVGAWA